jgi:DNA recombination protein RmuC
MTGLESIAIAALVAACGGLFAYALSLQRRLAVAATLEGRAQAAEEQAAALHAEAAAARAEASGARGQLALSQSERAALGATLQAREEQLREWRGAHESLAKELAARDLRARTEQQAATASHAGQLQRVAETHAAQQQTTAAAHAAELAKVRAALDQEIRTRADAESQLGRLEARIASEQARAAEAQALLEKTEARLKDTFHTLSGQALEQTSAQFMQLAETRFAQLQEKATGDLATRQQAIDQLVGPMREQLEKMGGQLQRLDTARVQDSSTLAETLKSLGSTQDVLRGETQRLVAALRAPQTRGRWAEVHLRRVVELAGLQERCDFVEQGTITSDDGTLRPDLVVHLPGGGAVVIDAKAPLLAWLDANQTGGPAMFDEAQRREIYVNHARQVRSHVGKLADKAYWSQFEKAPDFVVMFLPTEAALGAALEADPDLHEHAIGRHVLLATPMTLIALLRTVAYGWRQDAMAANAREIADQGRVLYKRLATLADHFGTVGRSLHKAVDAFNATIGSLERNVLPAARKLKDTQAASGEMELEAPVSIEALPRTVQAPELLPGLPENAN